MRDMKSKTTSLGLAYRVSETLRWPFVVKGMIIAEGSDVDG
jgi:hypothetical protein